MWVKIFSILMKALKIVDEHITHDACLWFVDQPKAISGGPHSCQLSILPELCSQLPPLKPFHPESRWLIALLIGWLP